MKILKRIAIAFGAIVGIALVGLVALYVAYDATLYAPERSARRDIVIRGGTLFDAASSEARPNPGLVVRDGVIACIGVQCTPPPDALEIDAAGLAILPGFIDLHRHFFGARENTNVLAAIWESARMMPGKRREMLEAGITSIRQLGDPRDAIFDVRRMLAASSRDRACSLRARSSRRRAVTPPTAAATRTRAVSAAP